MAINAKEVKYAKKGKDQPALEAGTYPARLVQVIDMGIQEQRAYDGKEKPPAQEIRVTYEFLDEFMKDDDGNVLEDKPLWLSENFVLHRLDSELAKSTKRYFALDPDASKANGDWGKLVGQPVMVTIVQNPGKDKNAGRIFNKITNISAMRQKEADKAPALKKEGKIFNFDDAASVDIMLTLPEWLQDTIKKALNWEGSKAAKALAERGDAAPVNEPQPENAPEEKEENEDW